MNAWKYWGKNEQGEGVFVRESGEVAVEKDHRHLTEPTPLEKQEIYRTWPGLLPECTESRRQCPGIARKRAGALKDRIIALEFEAAESRNLIAALTDANTAKDEMIVSLMQDIVELKESQGQDARNIRILRETVKLREEMIDRLAEGTGGEEYNSNE